MRVQHIKHALNPGTCFIFTDFVQCSYFELQHGNGVTALRYQSCKFAANICCLLSDRVWFVRLYGKIIHERQRVDFRPYRRTNHTLTSLLHLYAYAPCTLRDI